MTILDSPRRDTRFWIEVRRLLIQSLAEQGPPPGDLVMLRGGDSLRGWHARSVISRTTRRFALLSVTA